MLSTLGGTPFASAVEHGTRLVIDIKNLTLYSLKRSTKLDKYEEVPAAVCSLVLWRIDEKQPDIVHTR